MPPAPVSIDCPQSSDTGAYRIAWTSAQVEGAAPAPRFRIEENGALLYEGPHTATSVSGRTRGEYTYRVALVDPQQQRSAPTDSCTVAVTPPSMTLAFTLFGVGLVVFIATVVLVVLGHRAHRRGENLP